MASEDPIDAEIVDADESDSEARARSVALAHAGQSPSAIAVVVATPSGEEYRAYLREDVARYDPDELWIGAYNKTHAKPSLDEFQPAWNWSDADRAAMGLPMRPKARLALPANALDRPMRIHERVGLARLERIGHVHVAKILIRTDIDRAYVSHLTIGTRHGEILTAVQFDEPLRVLGGHHLQFGIVLGASQPALGARPARKAIE